MLSSNTAKRVTQMPDQPQPELRLAALTNLCKASADTLRLLVLRVLRKDSFGVSELCAIFDIRQPARCVNSFACRGGATRRRVHRTGCRRRPR